MTSKPDRLKRMEIHQAVTDLNTAFTYHLDHNNVEQLVALFTDDAIYTHGERRSEGKEAIAELFSMRIASGPRTARHIATGLRIDMESETSATGTSVCLTFARDGEPPVTPATPYLVADFNDVYVYTNGNWLIKKRHIERIFVDVDNAGPVGHKN